MEIKSKMTLAGLAAGLLTVGLVVFLVIGSRLSDPYIAAHYCPDGKVISEFRSSGKAGSYTYRCKSDATGQITLISEMWPASIIEMAVCLFIPLGFAAFSILVITKIWGSAGVLTA